MAIFTSFLMATAILVVFTTVAVTRIAANAIFCIGVAVIIVRAGSAIPAAAVITADKTGIGVGAPLVAASVVFVMAKLPRGAADVSADSAVTKTTVALARITRWAVAAVEAVYIFAAFPSVALRNITRAVETCLFFRRTTNIAAFFKVTFANAGR